MKKVIIALLSIAAAAGPIAATSAEAQEHRPGGPGHGGAHGPAARPHPGGRGPAARPQAGRPGIDNHAIVRNEGAGRRWNKGQRFDSRYAQNYQEIRDWRAYRGRRLYAPPRGYHWVRSGNDAVLVAVTGGLIGAVLAGAFN